MIAVCHAEASLCPQGSAVAGGVSSAPILVDCGLVHGRTIATYYKRVVMLRLRDLRLSASDSPFALLRGANVAEAAAKVIADLLQLSPEVPGSTPRDLAEDFFGGMESTASQTLWLLDGFDELPGAKALARTLSDVVPAAYHEANINTLASPSAALSEITFRARLAAEIAPDERLGAMLRVLLTQQNVIISSRPEFECDLGPLTGRTSPPYLRLELLSTKSVKKFVDCVLQVS